MAGITWVSVVCFYTIFSMFASLNECRSLNGYNFPVYTTDHCPLNHNEWEDRSSTLNCWEGRYMCLPNEHLTLLIEFCFNANRTRIPPSTCLYLHGKNSVLDSYNCSRFRHGCPNSSYFSNEIYKYQSCLSIGTGFFLAEHSCNSISIANTDTSLKPTKNCKQPNSTPSDERSDIVWIVVITLLCVTIAICAIFHWIKKPHISLACTLKLNDRDRSNIALNQDENTTFLERADQKKDAVNTADVPLRTDATEECYHTDNRRVLGKDTRDTSISADSGICKYDGSSPLHIACVGGHHDTVYDLIGNGANINACDNDGKSPLYLACEYGHVNLVEILLGGDADVNLRDNEGASPLFIASQQGHDVIVNLLLNHGANVNDKTNNIKQ